jgi:glycosyltransferase involved in cell wall biosynthesis
MSRISITAIVISCNEADLLERCLSSLAFCDELIVVNMECSDNTSELAHRHGAVLLDHVRTPTVEMVLSWVSSKASHPWILNIDPDEVIDPLLANDIISALDNETPTLGSIDIPWQFYFGNHPLKGTYWGGINYKKGCLFHRDRVVFSDLVHDRPKPKEGFQRGLIPWKGSNVMHHYWMKDHNQFLVKHRRHLAAEGKRRQSMGQHFSWPKAAFDTLYSFAWCLLRKNGWRDGFTGLGLSGFYAWYVAEGWLSLRRLEMTESVTTSAAQ